MLCGFKHRQVYLASALYDCLEDENLHDIEVLLKFNGADPSVIIPEKGISPFHYVIGIDSTEFAFEVTNLFLRHGSNPNTRSSEEDLTPLHVAAAWGRLEILRLLLANGADPSLKDEDGCTALDLAVEEGHWNVVQEIKTHEMTSTHHGDGVISLTLDKVIISDGEVEAEYELLKNTESPIITKLKNDFKNTEKRDSVEEWREKYVTNKTNKYPETDSTCGGAYDDLTDYKIRRDKIKKRREKSFIEKWTNTYYCGSKKIDDNIKLPHSEGFEQQSIDMAHLEPVEYLNISSKFGKQNEQSISNSKQYAVETQNKSIIINNEKNDIIGNRIEVTEKTNTAPSNIEDCFKKPFDVIKPIGLCRKTDKTSLDSSVLESVKLDNDLKTPEKDLKSYDYLSESAWSDSMSFQTPKSVGSISGIKELKFTQIYPSDLNSDDFLSCTDDAILVTDTSNYTNCDPEVVYNTIETQTATSTHPKVKLQNCQINKVEENTVPAMSHHIKSTANIIQNNNYVYKSPIRSLINDFVTGENIKKNTTIDRHFSLVSADFSLVTSDCSIDNVLNEQIYFNNTFTIDSVSTTESLVEEEEKIAPSKVIKSAIDLIAPSKVINSAIDLIAPSKVIKSAIDLIAQSKVIKSTIDLIASENEISKIPMVNFNVNDSKKRRSKSESNLTDKILEASITVASTKSPNIMLKRSEMAAIDAKPDLILSGNRTLDVEPVFPTNKIKTIKMNNFKSNPNLAKGNMVTVPKTTLLGKKAPVLKTKESVKSNKLKSKSENAFISKYKNLNPKTKTENENKAVNIHPKCGTFTTKFPKFPKSQLPNISNKNAIQIKKQIPNFPKQGDDCKDIVSSHSDRQSFFVGVSEEYRYTDEVEGVELIERRLPVSPLPSFVSTTPASSSGSDISLPKVVDYDTDTLIRELTAFGLTPGPITKTTKKIYLKRIIKYKKKPPVLIDVGKTRPAYSVELEKTLRNPSWHLDLAHYVALEQTVSNQFASVDPKKRWREGLAKSSFTYLLLDPRVTENLPGRADVLTDDEKWKTFISAIFYVGKGKRSRPYSHLYQAVGVWNKGIVSTTDKKVQHILEIWNSQHGVVCLHVFQNVIPVEAFTREAAMIDVLTLKNLKNNKLGDYYGIAATWPQKQKRQLGVYLLYRAMLILMNEGERQLRPVDIG